jgi:hypothetical protein
MVKRFVVLSMGALDDLAERPMFTIGCWACLTSTSVVATGTSSNICLYNLGFSFIHLIHICIIYAGVLYTSDQRPGGEAA